MTKTEYEIHGRVFAMSIPSQCQGVYSSCTLNQKMPASDKEIALFTQSSSYLVGCLDLIGCNNLLR